MLNLRPNAGRRTIRPSRLLLMAVLLPAASLAQRATPPAVAPSRVPVSAPVEEMRFEVVAGLEQMAARAYDVTLRFRVRGPTPVLLSMPIWTPGSYRVADHARAVSRLTAAQGGRELTWANIDPDTWRVVPRGAGVVELSYRVAAEAMDVASSWTSRDFGFFNGTNLFLAVEGRLETPATVVVRTEPSWLVATAMTADDSTHRFRASDFHDLVDHPVFVGRFDLDSALVAERWMRFATWPVGSIEGARRAALWDGFTRVVDPLVAVFGEVPWARYTVLQVVSPEFGGMSALEHSASELAIVGAPFLDAPFVLSIHAHEFAHAWNVKRLRPADLFPYRYDAPQPTPWLWVSEGITDYYADLALVRSGARDESEFLETTLTKIESVGARPPTALEDASLQAWLGVRDGTADLYYDKVSLAGLALDILIRDASNNATSLDDVMRELYERAYKQGRGFTHDDFWNAVARASRGRAFGDFERRYIDGRDAYPWRDWLPRAGWRMVVDSTAEPRLGALLAAHELGVRVTSVDVRGAGGSAGLRVGDVITAIGDRAVNDPGFGSWWREHWGRRPGARMPVTIRRGEESFLLEVIVELVPRVERRIEPDPNANAKAQRIRAGILRGRDGR
jgi:predicted metalloprotease with PDZ domain